MKTLIEWEKSNLNFDKYITEPCEVDEDLIVSLAYHVGNISDYENGITQINEAEDSDEKGNLIYATFIEKYNKFYYIGNFIDCSENDISFILKTI